MIAGWYNFFSVLITVGCLVLLPAQFALGQTARTNDSSRVEQGQVSIEDREITELWTGSLYSSTYRAGLCVAPNGDVRGVLHLKLANGEVSVYHFYGEMRQGRIEVSHSSGHVFKGHLPTEDAVEGTVRLKNGMRIRMEGKRSHNVRLAPSNCAPLPQEEYAP